MKDLRRAYNMAWEEAERMKGDFQDCLLHCLSQNLGMPILNEVKRRVPTDEGVEEMCAGLDGTEDGLSQAQGTIETN